MSKALPDPQLMHDGSRQWWRFGNAVTVTTGMSSKGPTFCCHTDTSSHDCMHIRALENYLDIRDYRNMRDAA